MESLFADLGYLGEVGWVLDVASKPALKRHIPRDTIGVYLLIANRQIVYAGRSDSCLRRRLTHHEHLPAARIVAWRACASVRAAYRLERLWYGRLAGRAGVLNRVLPATPAGAHNTLYFGEVHARLPLAAERGPSRRSL